ncbi:zinc finger MYM-type protein 1-like, partial [Aphis craccivora]
AYDKFLSSSQVTCERSFSTLKNSLSQPFLEAFILISCEKDILTKLNNDEIIKNLAMTSEHFKKKLLRFYNKLANKM